MNRYYDARAPWHDSYMHFESTEQMEAVLAPIVESLSAAITGREVLEIACGTGNWTGIVARRARRVTAIDYSTRCLGIAREKLQEYGNVRFLEHDAYRLVELTEKFDVIVAADWWSHIPSALIRDFLSGIANVSKPGAVAIFIDILESDYFRDEPHRIDVNGDRISERVLPDGSCYRVVKNFPAPHQLAETIALVGRNFAYRDFVDLQRWMMTFEMR